MQAAFKNGFQIGGNSQSHYNYVEVRIYLAIENSKVVITVRFCILCV